MPKITPETPLRDLVIAGRPFKIPAPYAEGHAMDASEAAALNQTFAENIRNNFAIQIKRKTDKAEADKTELPSLESLQDELAIYAEAYEFGVRRSSTGSVGTSADPVEAELQKIARDLIKSRIKERGHRLKSFPEEMIQDLIDKLIAARPDLREEAERRVNSLKSFAGDELGGLTLPEAPAADAAADTGTTEGAEG